MKCSSCRQEFVPDRLRNCSVCGAPAPKEVHVRVEVQRRSARDKFLDDFLPAFFWGMIFLVALGIAGWYLNSSQYHQVVVIAKDGWECSAIDYPCRVFVFDETSGNPQVLKVSDATQFKSLKPDDRFRVHDKFLRYMSWQDEDRLDEIRQSTLTIRIAPFPFYDINGEPIRTPDETLRDVILRWGFLP